VANLTGFKRDNDGAYIEKAPTANLQYAIDFTDYLNSGDSISSATVAISTASGDSTNDLRLPTNAATDVIVTNPVVNIRLHNGTVGNIYNIRCKITTSYGDVDARHFRIVVKDKVL
jgi:hypothetical protein